MSSPAPALPSLATPVPGATGGVALREAGRAALALGMPTRKTERFRTFPTREVLERATAPETGKSDASSAARHAYPGLEQLVLDGGRPVREASVRGARVTTRDDDDTFSGSLAAQEFFVAANAASFPTLVCVEVAAGAEAALQLVHLAPDAPGFTAPRVLVTLGVGARLLLVETFAGGAASVINHVVEADVGGGARMDHLIEMLGEGSTVSTAAARVGKGGTYAATSLLAGGRPARLDHEVTLAGEDAEVALAGALLGRGEAHVDHHVRVRHAAPRGRSSMRFRGLADDASTVVFDGIAEVRPGANGCDIVQESKNLLLSRKATVHAKPHLEIEIDEVSASHGVTVGSLDRDALFYLRTRGIGEADARAMLQRAFVASALAGLPERVRAIATTRLLGDAGVDALPDEPSSEVP